MKHLTLICILSGNSPHGDSREKIDDVPGVLARRTDAASKHQIELLWFADLVACVRVRDRMLATQLA